MPPPCSLPTERSLAPTATSKSQPPPQEKETQEALGRRNRSTNAMPQRRHLTQNTIASDTVTKR